MESVGRSGAGKSLILVMTLREGMMIGGGFGFCGLGASSVRSGLGLGIGPGRMAYSC